MILWLSGCNVIHSLCVCKPTHVVSEGIFLGWATVYELFKNSVVTCVSFHSFMLYVYGLFSFYPEDARWKIFFARHILSTLFYRLPFQSSASVLDIMHSLGNKIMYNP